MTEDDFCTLQLVHPILSATFLQSYVRYRTLMGAEASQIRVTSGLRNASEQERLVKQGASRTMDSAHLRGLAIDIAFLSPDRKFAQWELHKYREFNGFMQAAFRGFSPALPEGSLLIWGGTWTRLVDGVHWELSGVEPTQAPWL